MIWNSLKLAAGSWKNRKMIKENNISEKERRSK
jgi:hypothetical protein